MSYETFEHTADVGLRILAQSVDQLFAEAARGLFSLIVADPTTVGDREQIEIRLASEAVDLLLFDWLGELLYLYETRQLLLCRFDIRVQDARLHATVGGETIDRTRHVLDHEVKAITYHGLKVEATGGAWLAEVIVDI